MVASKQNGPLTRTMPVVDLGAIDQYLLGRRFVVGDRFQSDVRNDSSDLFPLLVLFALVNKPTCRTSGLVLVARTMDMLR